MTEDSAAITRLDKSDDIAYVSVFVTTKSGTRAYDWSLEDGDRLTMKYETHETRNYATERMHVNSNWLKLITGPEAGTKFHRPTVLSKLRGLVNKK
jgi:hypothetical protein